MRNQIEDVSELENSKNYDISDLNSNDETDQEDFPKKKVPLWESKLYLLENVKNQACLNVDFEKLFRASAKTDIKVTNQTKQPGTNVEKKFFAH